jgi:hypothetical protein
MAEHINYEILTAMLLNIQVFWDVLPCRRDLNLVNLCVLFGSSPVVLILCPESILLMQVFIQMYRTNVTEVGSKQGWAILPSEWKALGYLSLATVFKFIQCKTTELKKMPTNALYYIIKFLQLRHNILTCLDPFGSSSGSVHQYLYKR